MKKEVLFIIAVVTAAISMFLNYMITLILTPYITNTLGSDAYGFIVLANTVANYTIILTTCLNAFLARFITISYHNNDLLSANRYYSSAFYGNIFLFIVVILIASYFIARLDTIINIPSSLVFDVKMLFFYNFANCLILSAGSVFTIYSYIDNRLDIYNLVKIIASVIQSILLVVLFSSFSANIQYVGLSLLFASFSSLIINYLICKKRLIELKISHNFISIQSIKDLVLSGLWNSINSLGNILNSGLDLLIANLVLSVSSMGVLSIVKTLSTIFSSLFHLVSVPFQPLLLKEYANGNINGVINIFKTGIKCCSALSNVLFSFLFAFSMHYFKIWTPNQDIELLRVLLIITMAGCVVEGPAYPLFYAYTLTLKNKIPCIVTIISGLINVVSMFLLLRYTDLGVISVVITTTILAWIVFFIFTPFYVEHCLKIQKGTFLIDYIKVLIATIVCTILCNFCSIFVNPNTWIELIALLAVLGTLCLACHCIITFNISDYQYIIRLLHLNRSKS